MDWLETAKAWIENTRDQAYFCEADEVDDLAEHFRAAHEAGCEWKRRSKLEDDAAVENDKLRLSLAAARAACGEAREMLLWMEDRADFEGFSGWFARQRNLMNKLYAIAEGKEGEG